MIREIARTDYSFYAEYVHRGVYRPARHHRLICSYLEAVERGDITRLMIFMPPRHGKSMTVSETFPSFFIGKKPHRRVIEVSYGQDLARKFGRANRQKVEEFGRELFGIYLARDNSSVVNWDIEGNRGGMISVGIGGPITGQGADLLLIDDPIKNRKEADSKTYRDMVWNEYRNTLYTRLHPGGRIIIILTRWHEDDLAGRLLNPELGYVTAEEAAQWTVLSLPAEAEEYDPLGRNPGDPLWPEHGFDKAWLEATKRAVGSQAWAALYQQRPSPQEGSLFKRHWWRFYTELPNRFDEMLQSWDCTFKDGDSSDYVVGQVWGRVGGDFYLLDQVRDRMDLPATMRAIETLAAKWPNAYAKLIEDKANGPAVIQMLQHKIPGLLAVNPEGGKVVRAAAVSPVVEAGNVYLPPPGITPWIHDFMEECAVFPNGAYDDQVDAMTQALIRMMNRRVQIFV